MKKQILIIFILCFVGRITIIAQSVGIGTDTPNTNSILDISSTNKGLLIPRVSFDDRSIMSAAILGSGENTDGMLVYDNSEHKFYFWDQTNFTWKELGDGDQQTITTFSLSGDVLDLEIERGNYVSVDLSPIDNQNIQNLALAGNELTVGITDGNPASIDLSPIDNQDIDSLTLDGTRLQVFISNGDSSSIDLSTLSGGSGWSLNGNAGTNSNTNFIGTTDAQDLSFRVNNTEKLRLTQKGVLAFKNTGNSVFIGENAGVVDDLTDNKNTYIGANAGMNSITGRQNVAIGANSLHDDVFSRNNVAIGYESAFKANDANQNVAIGAFTLHENKTGINNVAIGFSALYNGLNNNSCIAIGYDALSGSFGTFDNVAIGNEALTATGAGEKNVGLGSNTLFRNTSGNLNTAIGYYAGAKTTLSDSCLFLGALASTNAIGSNYDNSIAIGTKATVTASHQTRIGTPAMVSIGGYQDWTNLSDQRFKTDIKENVPGLDFILRLKPVTYKLDLGRLNTFLGRETEKSGISQQVHTGFLAQEVEEVTKDIHYNFSGIDKPQNDKDHYGLRYATFVVPLVKSVQELSEENQQLRAEL